METWRLLEMEVGQAGQGECSCRCNQNNGRIDEEMKTTPRSTQYSPYGSSENQAPTTLSGRLAARQHVLGAFTAALDTFRRFGLGVDCQTAVLDFFKANAVQRNTMRLQSPPPM